MGKLPSNRQYKEEADLLKDVTEWLEPQFRDGIKIIRINERYKSGYSDLFLCVRGVFVAIELKDDEGVASPQQLNFLRDILACGGIGGVCRTVAEVANYVELAKQRVSVWPI